MSAPPSSAAPVSTVSGDYDNYEVSAAHGRALRGGPAGAVQLVPYGRDHDNPPVVRDAPWPSAGGRRLAVAACYDCHSNETKWPLYSYVAPMSWLVQRDVDNGRRELNFSTWDGDAADDAADAVEDGSMPPRNYTLLHPDARLSAEEKAALIRELRSLEDDDDRRGSNRGPG